VEEEVEVVTGVRPEEGVEESVMLTKKANAQEEVLVDFLIKYPSNLYHLTLDFLPALLYGFSNITVLYQ
jgi:sialic acid synthase SpsE